jgi:ribokinase
MRSGKIVIIGSSNMDMVVKADHIPAPGETLICGSFLMNPGGKGANQAVSVARLGGEPLFICKVGNDVFGKQFTYLFNDEQIDTSFVLSDENLPSGVALITVAKGGENSIVVASGANANLFAKDIEPALDEIAQASILLLQLEIPMETVHYAIGYAAARGVKIILNPAPASVLSAELLRQVDILTPNETEAGMISGMRVTNMETAKKAAAIIRDKGVKNVVVTMGKQGAVVCDQNGCLLSPAPKVEAIDTTAAGDVFNGALAVALSEGKTLEAAARFACEAAAISVTRLGAQSSIPYRNEIITGKLDLAD